MPREAKTEEQKAAEKALKLKEKTATELNAVMAEAYADLQKKMDAILKKRKMWYSTDESIKDHAELHEKGDRNSDQAIIDHFAEIADDMFNHVTPDCLWTESDIEEDK